MKTKKYLQWDRFFILGMRWARLPKAAKSLLPVMLAFTESYRCDIQQQRLSYYSGRDLKTVRKGIRGLQGGFQGDNIIKFLLKYTPENPNIIVSDFSKIIIWYRNEYHMEWHFGYIPPKYAFKFPESIIYNKIWRKLKPTAHALYPVIKCLNSKPILKVNKSKMAKYAGISRRSINGALSALQELKLIPKPN